VFPLMPFPHRIIIEWSDDAEAYVATVQALDVVAEGETPAAALRKLIVAAVTAMEHGSGEMPMPGRDRVQK
jgi:predicted RNase H-like HicB family nuclease